MAATEMIVGTGVANAIQNYASPSLNSTVNDNAIASITSALSQGAIQVSVTAAYINSKLGNFNTANDTFLGAPNAPLEFDCGATGFFSGTDAEVLVTNTGNQVDNALNQFKGQVNTALGNQ